MMEFFAVCGGADWEDVNWGVDGLRARLYLSELLIRSAWLLNSTLCYAISI